MCNLADALVSLSSHHTVHDGSAIHLLLTQIEASPEVVTKEGWRRWAMGLIPEWLTKPLRLRWR